MQGRTTRSRCAFAAAITLLAASCGGGLSDTTAAGTAPDAPTTTTTAATGTSPTTTTTTAPADPGTPSLAGTSWNVTLYNLPTGGMTNPWPGTEITLQFLADGTVAGFSGCNEFSGTYAVEGPYDEFVDGVADAGDGQAMAVGPLTMTERACESPAGVMEQETEFLDALADVGRWVLVRGNLSLRSDDGFLLAEAEPA